MNTTVQSEYCTCIELDMQRWLERAVIGLNLCPFAKAVHVKKLIRYKVCVEVNPDLVLLALGNELLRLSSETPDLIETSLLILPKAFPHFLEFNDFFKKVNKLLKSMKLEGIIQVANFHPEFQFSGTEANDITNFTNRAPYPTLHLLRETSIDRAVEAFPKSQDIFGQNMETLIRLGHAGWSQLDVGASVGEIRENGE